LKKAVEDQRSKVDEDNARLGAIKKNAEKNDASTGKEQAQLDVMSKQLQVFLIAFTSFEFFSFKACNSYRRPRSKRTPRMMSSRT